MDATDSELVTAIAAGDVDALGVLYRRHVDRVVGYAAGRCRDPHEVADVVSVVWMSVWQSAGSFDPDRGDALGWIIGIAAHRFADLRRKEQRSEALLNRLAGRRLLDSDDIERLADRIDAARAVGTTEAALERLPESQRSAFELVGLAGMSAEQAAVLVGSSPGAVRMRLSRARQSMRGRIAAGDPALEAQMKEERP